MHTPQQNRIPQPQARIAQKIKLSFIYSVLLIGFRLSFQQLLINKLILINVLKLILEQI